MTTGGLVVKALTPELRQRADTPNIGLFVEYVGQYNEHAAGKRAGFQKDDVIVSVDGKASPMTESELMGYLVQNRMPGTKIPVTIWRGGQRLNLELPMQ